MAKPLIIPHVTQSNPKTTRPDLDQVLEAIVCWTKEVVQDGCDSPVTFVRVGTAKSIMSKVFFVVLSSFGLQHHRIVCHMHLKHSPMYYVILRYVLGNDTVTLSAPMSIYPFIGRYVQG